MTFLLAVFSGVIGSQAGVDSIGDPELKWNTHKIRACWMTTRLKAIFPVRRKTIRDLILTNYPASLTGIKFTGFGDCPSGLALKDFDLWLGTLFSFLEKVES